jgi:hypothetical protein
MNELTSVRGETGQKETQRENESRSNIKKERKHIKKKAGETGRKALKCSN